jgi:hypothetical protein
MVQSQLVDYSCFKSDHEYVISGGIDCFNGIDKPLVSGQMQSHSALHTSFITL